MTMQSPSDDEQPPVTELFRALADPGRLAILRHLYGGEHNVRELTEHLDLAQSTVSAHLACLRDCGLVTVAPRGRSSLYSLTAPQALTSLLDAAERMLTVAGPARPHLVEVSS